MLSWLRSFKLNDYFSSNKTKQDNEKNDSMGTCRYPDLRRKCIHGVFQMTRVDNSLTEKIIGKWIHTDTDGETVTTDMKSVYTFEKNGDVPVGLVRDGIKEPKVWIDYAHVADTKDGEGQPMFSRSIVDYSSLPDGWQLYRRLLAEQPDRSV